MRKGGLYLSIGDSTTWQQVVPGKDQYTSRVFRAICKDYSPIRFINKGHGGADSLEAKNNIPWNMNLKPDLVTIGLGMNDAFNTTVPVATYQANLEAMIDALKLRNPNVVIILCTPNQTTDAARSTIQQYRDAMATAATNKGVSVCRFENAWTSGQTGTYTSDGVHPNSAGHQLLFNLLYPIVQSSALNWLNKLGK